MNNIPVTTDVDAAELKLQFAKILPDISDIISFHLDWDRELKVFCLPPLIREALVDIYILRIWHD